MHGTNLPEQVNGVSSGYQAYGTSGQLAPKKKLPLTAIMFAIVLVIQAATLFFVVNPPYLQQQNLARQIIDDVASKTKVNPFETPIISMVADAENLKKANSIQATVYKDAQNGDYVLGYSDKMVIYRKESGQVMYEGDSPGSILNKNQQNLTQAVLGVATSKGYIQQGEDVTPQMSVVTDPDALKKQDGQFYANAQKGDVIAIFPTKQLILLIRSNNGQAQVISSGAYKTDIEAK